jgi:hypothetical protein
LKASPTLSKSAFIVVGISSPVLGTNLYRKSIERHELESHEAVVHSIFTEMLPQIPARIDRQKAGARLFIADKKGEADGR